MKAINTRYNDHYFRSRLEARWAVVFDALGIKYEYEKEGYELKSGLYLPDFWLTELSTWIEIKGEKPTPLEEQLALELTQSTEHPSIILWGDIPSRGWSETGSGIYIQSDWSDEHYILCECPDCGHIDFSFDGRSDRLRCKRNQCPTHAGNKDKHYTGDAPRILLAYQRAREARFEHGATPLTYTIAHIPHQEYDNIVDYDDLPF